jgi:hypothetical protein
MKTLKQPILAIMAILAWGVAVLASDKTLDLRRAASPDAFLVVHRKHNPERDFQRKYLQDVWNTVEETQIIERAVKIIASRMSREDVDKAKAVLEEIRAAVAPIKLQALLDSKELLFVQEMRPISEEIKAPTIHQLVVARVTPEAAAATQQGIRNLFELLEKYSAGQVPVESGTEGDAAVVTLALPRQVSLRPTVIRLGEVLLLSTSEELARQGLDMLVRGDGKSKFDDPRLAEALARLPKPEDGLVFYDMQKQMAQMRGTVDFVRAVGQNDSRTQRIAGILETVFDEAAILDYEVTVEYTEDNLNRTAVYGKLAPGAENKTLFKIFASGEPFADWQTWVPANAKSYSLTTGVNLHPLYERIIDMLKERFPEAERGLERFEKAQSRIGVRLDADLLQNFSGECVSISLPSASPSPLGGGSFLATRCRSPERIRELLHRAIEALKRIPALSAQQIQIAKCEDLEGFEQVSALALTGLGVKPVIGFHDGWMMIGSNAETVKAVLATRAGKAPSIVDAPSFQQFKLKVEGPVYSIRYTNTAENICQAAALLNQAGLMGPMLLGMVGAKADQEKLKPVQEALALLPSLGKIVAKFDFRQAELSVTQAGSEPGVYQRRTVTVIRPAGKR